MNGDPSELIVMRKPSHGWDRPYGQTVHSQEMKIAFLQFPFVAFKKGYIAQLCCVNASTSITAYLEKQKTKDQPQKQLVLKENVMN